MRTKQRAYKLQEFVAHSATVNTIAIGHKSGRVLATGGDDRKVNIWAVGKANALMSLGGHTSPVESLAFDVEERLVAGGSTGGTLKVWDLEQSKVIRTMPGHKSSILSIAFHSYGDFFASGSMDTTVRVWDVRRKGCLFSYKGHADAVNVCRVTPDGRWVISGDNAGVVKIWDLTAGRLVKDFVGHEGPITDLALHPHEFLLATSSADRSVRFWDLETFESVAVTEPETTRVRSVQFTPDGQVLLAASQDALRVYGWEPLRTYDTEHVRWNRVGDVAIAGEQFIACSMNQTFVSVWMAPLDKLAPYGAPGTAAGVVGGPPPTAAASTSRRSVEALPSQAPAPKTAPPPSAAASTSAPTATAQKPKTATKARLISQPQLSESGQHISVGIGSMPAVDRSGPPLPAAAAAADFSRPAARFEVPAAGTSRDRPIGLDPSAFVPKHVAKAGRRSPHVADDEIMEEILSSHSTMIGVLNTRLTNLQVVRKFWARGDVRAAMDSLSRNQDQSTVKDVLEVLNQRPNLYSLDICMSVLPLLEELLLSKFEDYVLTALKALQLFLKSFGPLIRQHTATRGGSVNVAHEERAEKCVFCYDAFQRLHPSVETLEHKTGKVGFLARDVSGNIKMLG